MIFLLSVLSADAVNNAAGYGFLGMDENGKPSWDLICNLNILGIEVPSVFHMIQQTELGDLILCKISCTIQSLAMTSGLEPYSFCYVVIFLYCFFVCFLDCNQLQDIHRQLEYSDRNLAQDVSAANVNLSAHAQRKHLLSFPFLLNMSDSSHLLRVCYDRAPKHRLALTFILSALWHGVYPGYYFTFITAIPITMAARAVSTLPPPEIQINTSVYNW